METVYEKYRPAHEVLIEYYSYEDLRRILKIEWEEEDRKYQQQCDKLYEEYETAAANERKREENSKSARIGATEELFKVKLHCLRRGFEGDPPRQRVGHFCERHAATRRVASRNPAATRRRQAAMRGGSTALCQCNGLRPRGRAQ